MRNKILILISILLMAALLSSCAPALSAQAQGTQTPSPAPAAANLRTISVDGSGKAYLDPDIAYIYIGVHTEAEDAATAVENNNTQSQKVADALKAMKIDPKDIQTTNFSIYPQQQYDPQGKLQSTRYAVDNTVYVTLRDLTKLGDVLDSVIAAGANSINGVQFDVADRTKALSDARKAAIQDAQAQAKELASAAGLQLGDIQAISTSTLQQPIPMYQGKGGAAVEAAAASVPISPGQLVVSVDVSVVYQVK